MQVERLEAVEVAGLADEVVACKGLLLGVLVWIGVLSHRPAQSASTAHQLHMQQCLRCERMSRTRAKQGPMWQVYLRLGGAWMTLVPCGYNLV